MDHTFSLQKSIYLSRITISESNPFLCLLAEMIFLSSLSMARNTFAVERDIWLCKTLFLCSTDGRRLFVSPASLEVFVSPASLEDL